MGKWREKREKTTRRRRKKTNDQIDHGKNGKRLKNDTFNPIRQYTRPIKVNHSGP